MLHKLGKTIKYNLRLKFYILILSLTKAFGLLGCSERQPPAKPPGSTASASERARWYVPSYGENGFPAPEKFLMSTPQPLQIPVIMADSVPTGDSIIALTFDACSTLKFPLADTTIIRILVQTQTPATFFLGGAWVLAHPEITRRIAETPFFEIGNHSYLHGHLTQVSKNRLDWEMRYTQDIIYTVTGRIPHFFRAPYLESNEVVQRTASSLGLFNIGGMASGDPDPNSSARILTDRIRNYSRPGTIWILHANGRGWHTAQALPGILNALKEKRLEPVTLSRLARRRYASEE